jgi:hypothetical protein
MLCNDSVSGLSAKDKKKKYNEEVKRKKLDRAF